MRGIQGSFRSETTDWEEGAWEGLGGLTRESVEQDASVPKKGRKSFERDATLPVSSKMEQFAKEQNATFSLSCNSSKELGTPD